MRTTTTDTVNARYSKVMTLVLHGATSGERAAARAAQVRMLDAHPELTTWHPLRQIDGFSWEIDLALKGLWTRSPSLHGWTTDTTELAWALRGHDVKELRNALRALRAERSAGWLRGVYVGKGDLKFFTCAEWLLQVAVRAAAAAEGATDEEAAALAA